MDNQTEIILSEILGAIETGTAEANNKVINSTTLPDLRDVLLHTGNIYAGYIEKAVVEVIKKYTEGE